MKYKQKTKVRSKLMKQIRQMVKSNPAQPTLRSVPMKLPPPEDYTPLPRTWDEFQTSQSRFLHHPIWDLCSAQEYYKWTEGWAWNEQTGHTPTDEMRKKEWENTRPTMIPRFDVAQAFDASPIQQCMNSMSASSPSTASAKKKKRTTKFPPTTIPGTPDDQSDEMVDLNWQQANPHWSAKHDKYEAAVATSGEYPQKTEYKKEKHEKVEDIELYYRIFHEFRPEQGESNAESAERTVMINKE